MDRFTEAVRSFFDRLNQCWITGDTTALAKSAGCDPSDNVVRRWLQRIQQKQRELRRRRSRLLRTHTKVTIVQMEPGSGQTVRIIVDECVTWVYRDRHDYGVESRVIRHWQKWAWRKDRWVLIEDSTSTEEVKRSADAAIVQDGGPSSFGVWGDEVQEVRASRSSYDRVRAQRYAELWWNSYNPAFIKFIDDDCTNYVSQCLLAGHRRMTGGQNRATGWWYRNGDASRQPQWSYSWSVANALHQYLVTEGQATVVSDPRELKVGDLIMYDWSGNGRITHSTMVVDFDSSGDPLVNAHTISSYHRHYQYLDSPAWTSQTKYTFLHVPDTVL